MKVSRKAGCVLTSDEVHFVSLAANFTVQFSNLLKPPLDWKTKQLNGPGNYRELRETGSWTFLLHEFFFFTFFFARIFFLGNFPCMNFFLVFPPPPHHFSNGPSLSENAECFFVKEREALGPSYMVSGTRDNPSPEVTLSSVYM